MTIGIGFNCDNGVVIATDTQYTRKGTKSNGPKVFTPLDRPDVALLVAGAGYLSFFRRVGEKLARALEEHIHRTSEDVREAAESVLRDFYEEHIYINPRSSEDANGLELLIGVWTEAEGRCSLFRSSGTVVTPVVFEGGTGYYCIGSGYAVSKYALELTRQDSLTVETAKLLGAFCVKASKDFDAHCSGRTEIWTLTPDGNQRIRRVSAGEVDDAEKYSVDLFDTMRLLLSYLDLDCEPGYGIELMTDEIKSSILRFREKQSERRKQAERRKARRREDT